MLNTEIQFFSNASLKVDTCMEYTRPSLALGIESIRKSFLDAKGRDVKLRYITEITTENFSYCKELMKIADVRHLDGIKGNFMVSEKEYLAPAASNNTSNIASQIIYSNLHVIVEQQQCHRHQKLLVAKLQEEKWNCFSPLSSSFSLFAPKQARFSFF